MFLLMTGKSWQVVIRSRPSGDMCDVLENSHERPLPGERPISFFRPCAPGSGCMVAPGVIACATSRRRQRRTGTIWTGSSVGGFSAFLACGEETSSARRGDLHLPTNERACCVVARRDHWLRRAWMLLDGANSILAEVGECLPLRSTGSKSRSGLVGPLSTTHRQVPMRQRRRCLAAFRSHRAVAPGTAMPGGCNIAGHCRASWVVDRRSVSGTRGTDPLSSQLEGALHDDPTFLHRGRCARRSF